MELRKCTEKYLFYWYAKFCSNILITDDTGNAQSLKSACISSNPFFLISFLMRNGTFKWIQLKNYPRYPYDSFFMLKYIMCTSKPSFCLSILGLYPYLYISIYPPKGIFLIRNVVFWKLYHVSKNRDMVLRFAYIQTISQNKNEKQASRLGVESRIVKISVFPKNAKTMSYD